MRDRREIDESLAAMILDLCWKPVLMLVVLGVAYAKRNVILHAVLVFLHAVLLAVFWAIAVAAPFAVAWMLWRRFGSSRIRRRGEAERRESKVVGTLFDVDDIATGRWAALSSKRVALVDVPGLVPAAALSPGRVRDAIDARFALLRPGWHIAWGQVTTDSFVYCRGAATNDEQIAVEEVRHADAS